jgi:flagellar motor switch protein FliN/FliY
MNPIDQINRLADVPLQLEVQLDSRRCSVAELVNLRPGSLLRMSRPAGERLEVFAGGAPFAKAEVVILADKAGIRITEFQTPKPGSSDRSAS